ncbi:membrane protein of ER body-like protein [Raphanus sativus]|nr:membrane protein of ER body-like protein [Raphanus sativus]
MSTMKHLFKAGNSLFPSAVEEPTQKKNNKDGPSAVVRLFPIKRSPPDSRTPDVPLLTPPVVEGRKPEILKSIVYGGLTEAITSLGVISSPPLLVLQHLLEEYGWSDGSETPVGEMMLSLMGKKAGGFGYSSSY